MFKRPDDALGAPVSYSGAYGVRRNPDFFGDINRSDPGVFRYQIQDLQIGVVDFDLFIVASKVGKLFDFSPGLGEISSSKFDPFNDDKNFEILNGPGEGSLDIP